MGKSKIFDVMSFLQSYSQSLSRKPIVNSEFYDCLTLPLVTRFCAFVLLRGGPLPATNTTTVLQAASATSTATTHALPTTALADCY